MDTSNFFRTKMPVAERKEIIKQALDAQHEGTEALAVENTLFRRILILVALKTTALFYQRDGPCVPISRKLIVKTGPFVHLTEAATMRFVADNTSLPVPRVYTSFVHKKRAYIVMQRIHGEDLPQAWGKLSKESQDKIFTDLKGMFQELRALRPGAGMGVGVESCVGGSLRDSRIPRSFTRMGPWKAIQDFHLWLREGLQPSEVEEAKQDQDWQDIIDMAAKQDGPWPAPVFTHGDLNPFNILLCGDEVAGIIDWEFAGWYPHYWEYTSAWFGNLIRTGWQRDLDKFLEPHPTELEMERTRHKWWGEF